MAAGVDPLFIVIHLIFILKSFRDFLLEGATLAKYQSVRWGFCCCFGLLKVLFSSLLVWRDLGEAKAQFMTSDQHWRYVCCKWQCIGVSAVLRSPSNAID